VDDGQLLLASPNPLTLDVEEDIRSRVGMPVRMVLCTPADVNRLINQHYTREAATEEVRSRTNEPKPGAEPSGLAKFWSKMKELSKKDLGGGKK
jgi:hypothetical protein